MDQIISENRNQLGLTLDQIDIMKEAGLAILDARQTMIWSYPLLYYESNDLGLNDRIMIFYQVYDL